MDGADIPRISVRLLGPITVLDGDGTEVDAGTAGPRTVLAVLALRANTVVTLDELVDALWGESAPRTAENCVYTHVSTLRKALEPGRARREKPRVLTSTRDGYLLRLHPAAVDVHRFEKVSAEARRHWSAGDFPGTLDRCDAALAEWTGPTLGGATGPFAEAERARLDMLKVDLQELRSAALIETGAPEAAVATLSTLTAANPLRERLHELLMLAFHETSRQAEALAVYQTVRRQLVEELGTEPGPALRQMHEHVLAGGIAELPPVASGPAPSRRVVPAQLPHAISDFVGREDEVRQLLELCTAAADTSSCTTAQILTVDGAPGVGKTALAIHVAHEAAQLFPDGQLFIDLHGFSPNCSPVTPQDALGRLLRSLGAHPDVLRADLAARAALYRSLLAGRRMMVVLDNAVSSAQVRPLLPGSAGCVALITSRSRLSGLAVRNGATRISVGTLRPDESLQILNRVLGAERVNAEIEQAHELAACCGHLTLALRIAAERLSDAENYKLADMLDELRAERSRLDTLSALDDESSTLRAVFSWSYRALKPEQARAFRLCSLHPGVELSADAAAALLGTDTSTARRNLDGLVGGRLLEHVAPGRYCFHDLLRIYAAECAERDEADAVLTQCFERMMEWYIRTAVAARTLLAHTGYRVQVEPTSPDLSPLAFATYEEARTWSALELDTLVEALRLADDRGFEESAALLAVAECGLFSCFDRWKDSLRVNEIGLAAARQAGDRLSEVRLLQSRGIAYQFLDRDDKALRAFEAVIDRVTERGDQFDPSMLANLAMAYSEVGRIKVSLPMVERAVSIARQTGNRPIESYIMSNFGELLLKLGRPDEAVEHARTAVELIRDLNAPHVVAQLLTFFGELCVRAAHPDEAVDELREALRLMHGLGNRWGEVRAMHALAEALYQTGRTEGVRELLTDALTIMRETGHLVVSAPKADSIRALLTQVT